MNTYIEGRMKFGGEAEDILLNKNIEQFCRDLRNECSRTVLICYYIKTLNFLGICGG